MKCECAKCGKSFQPVFRNTGFRIPQDPPQALNQGELLRPKKEGEMKMKIIKPYWVFENIVFFSPADYLAYRNGK